MSTIGSKIINLDGTDSGSVDHDYIPIQVSNCHDRSGRLIGYTQSSEDSIQVISRGYSGHMGQVAVSDYNTLTGKLPWKINDVVKWSAAKPLGKSLRKSLDKMVANKIMTTREVNATTVSIGKYGVELAVNSKIIIKGVEKSCATTLIMSPDTIRYGWTSALKFAETPVNQPHAKCVAHAMVERVKEHYKRTGDASTWTTGGGVSKKIVQRSIVAHLYSGMYCALKQKNPRAVWALGFNLIPCFLKDDDKEGCTRLLEFLAVVHNAIDPLDSNGEVQKSAEALLKIHHLLGEVYEEMGGKLKSAIRSYKNAIKVVTATYSYAFKVDRDTHVCKYFNDLGLAYKRDQQYEKSEITYDIALAKADIALEKAEIPNELRMSILRNLAYLYSAWCFGTKTARLGFQNMSKSKQVKCQIKMFELYNMIFAGVEDLHEHWSDIKLCQEEGVGCIRRSKKGQNCFDGPLLDVTYTIDPTSKMRIGISALGIVYKDFGGGMIGKERLGKWDKKKKKVVLLAASQIGYESPHIRFKRDHGIILDASLDPDEIYPFFEIPTLGRTWILDLNCKVVELPRIPPTTKFAPPVHSSLTLEQETNYFKGEKLSPYANGDSLRDKTKKGKIVVTKYCMQCSLKLEKVNKCSGCLEAYYCSAACQRAAWPVHKKSCRSKKGQNLDKKIKKANVPDVDDKIDQVDVVDVAPTCNSEPMKFKPGTLLTVCGLISRKDLNGKAVIVIRWSTKKDRYVVEMLNGTRICLREECVYQTKYTGVNYQPSAGMKIIFEYKEFVPEPEWYYMGEVPENEDLSDTPYMLHESMSKTEQERCRMELATTGEVQMPRIPCKPGWSKASGRWIKTKQYKMNSKGKWTMDGV